MSAFQYLTTFSEHMYTQICWNMCRSSTICGNCRSRVGKRRSAGAGNNWWSLNNSGGCNKIMNYYPSYLHRLLSKSAQVGELISFRAITNRNCDFAISAFSLCISIFHGSPVCVCVCVRVHNELNFDVYISTNFGSLRFGISPGNVQLFSK